MSSHGLPDFTGAWRITRRICGHDARFHGTARIDAQGHYHEDGIVRQPGYEGPAWRDYIYRAEGDAILRVFFPDGRVFLTLHFRDGQARDVHVCGDDTYSACWRLRKDGWVAAYAVSGPRKAYTAVSVMKRGIN